MKIPNKISEFLKDKDKYVGYIKQHKNCCYTYYQHPDDMFVIRDGYLIYYHMGLQENVMRWNIRLEY